MTGEERVTIADALQTVEKHYRRNGLEVPSEVSEALAILDRPKTPKTPLAGVLPKLHELLGDSMADFDPEAYLRDEVALDAARDLVAAWTERRRPHIAKVSANQPAASLSEAVVRTYDDGFDAAMAVCVHELRIAIGDDDATDEAQP